MGATSRSAYRGVSKNGEKWQALITIKGRKRYIGTREDQEEAAQLYDKYAILQHGL